MGIFGDLIGGITGATQKKIAGQTFAAQQKAAADAQGNAAGAYTQYGNQARNDLAGGIGNVRGLYQPRLNASMEGGEAGQRQYALLRGDQGAFDQYMSNPAQAALQAATAQRLGRYANASGKSYATSAGNSIANRGWLENYNTYQGQNAALGAEERGRDDAYRNALAGAETGYAGNMAQISQGMGQGIAGTYTHQGDQMFNALGQKADRDTGAANVFGTNLANFGGLALKATGWGGFAPPGNKVG
jgi:hypothetical protein